MTLLPSPLPPLPDPLGVAGAFAGVSDGSLIVAGGANFPDQPLADGGTKVWHDTVYALADTNQNWRSIGKLPRPLGYGVSITTPGGILCIGGSDAKGHRTNVLLLECVSGAIKFTDWPALPQPIANACGALVGNRVYVAGGSSRPDATNALNCFYALDLDSARPSWKKLPPWPGPPRMLAVAGTHPDAFYLISGVALYPDRLGRPKREYLHDAYRFSPSAGWHRIADVPKAVAAAPSPALALAPARFCIVSGDDGANVDFQPSQLHPGFSNQIFGYDAKQDRWFLQGSTPAPRVTTATVSWRGGLVIPSGELRPGIRSPENWIYFPSPK